MPIAFDALLRVTPMLTLGISTAAGRARVVEAHRRIWHGQRHDHQQPDAMPAVPDIPRTQGPLMAGEDTGAGMGELARLTEKLAVCTSRDETAVVYQQLHHAAGTAPTPKACT